MWVSVNQNQVLTLEVESEEEIKGITLTYPDATTEELTVSGNTYNDEITMTKNGVYRVDVTTETETKSAEKRITSLYAKDEEIEVIWFANNYLTDETERYETKAELLEAKGYNSIDELLEKEEVSSLVEYLYINEIYVEEARADLMLLGRQILTAVYKDNNQNLESVNKYGGYYIARYEAGDGTAKEARTETSEDTNTLVSKKGAYVYKWVSKETSKTLATGLRGSNTNVTTQLITGAGWDRTINWIVETGKKTEEEAFLDSGSWGNYKDSTGNAA